MEGVAPARKARRRVLIEAVTPEVDGGLYPVKRVLGDRVVVSGDLVCDGHDAVAGALLYRGPGMSDWRREELGRLGDDRFAASFVASDLGVWEFAVEAWVDAFTTWRVGTRRKLEAGQDVELDLAAGALLPRTWKS